MFLWQFTLNEAILFLLCVEYKYNLGGYRSVIESLLGW